jgi:peroxiredoxin
MILDDGQTDATQLLVDAGVRYSEIRNEDAEVLAITRSHARAAELRIRLKLGYPVLVDEDSLVYRQLGAIENTQQPSAAVYVLDRFGEVFGAYRKTAGEPLPNIPEVLKWLEFINAQCPECEPPEWPI